MNEIRNVISGHRPLFGAIAALAVFASASIANAAAIVSFYGDDDGFGVGQTAGNLTDPNTGHASVGEAPLTDIRLIATGFSGPAFQPAGTFTAFSLGAGEIITSASLTLRTGAFDSQVPIVIPNIIMLGGLTVPASFIDGFSTVNGSQIETRSVSLGAAFFPILATGSVSLAGTRITEADGSGSFQIDFLRLDIQTTGGAGVPDGGSTIALLLLSLAGLLASRYRK